MPEPDDGADAPPTMAAGRLYGRWYYDTYTVPYYESSHWKAFFGNVADAIIAQLAPHTVLDAGCAKGFLVAALRERGVDAVGFDVSEVALADAPEVARPHLRIGSLTEPIDGHFDLVTCVEVIEHLDPADGPVAVANLTSASDRVLLSSTPGDMDEPTHVNIQPPERWSQLFAVNGFYRDFRHDASYVSPWATLYRREDRSVGDVVVEYEREWVQLRAETIEQRKALLDMQSRVEEIESQHDEHGEVPARDEEPLRKELLRLRDLVVGRDAELATALGRVAELEATMARYAALEGRLDAVLNSKSWRLMWAAGAPLRKLRGQEG